MSRVISGGPCVSQDTQYVLFARPNSRTLRKVAGVSWGTVHVVGGLVVVESKPHVAAGDADVLRTGTPRTHALETGVKKAGHAWSGSANTGLYLGHQNILSGQLSES